MGKGTLAPGRKEDDETELKSFVVIFLSSLQALVHHHKEQGKERNIWIGCVADRNVSRFQFLVGGVQGRAKERENQLSACLCRRWFSSFLAIPWLMLATGVPSPVTANMREKEIPPIAPNAFFSGDRYFFPHVFPFSTAREKIVRLTPGTISLLGWLLRG